MSQPCPEAIRLRHELESCSKEKDDQIDSLSHQVNGIRGDLLRIDGDMKKLTIEVSNISVSLKTIADNTTQFMEVAHMYQHIKGFGFVVKNLGVLLVGAAALTTAVIYLSGVHISIGA